MSNRRLNAAWNTLETAETWAAYQEIAAEIDRLTEADTWRLEDESFYYDADLLRTETFQLRHLREKHQGSALVETLTNSLYRHRADIAATELYSVALCGTKRLITNYLDEVEAALRWLATTQLPEIPNPQKLQRFENAWRVFGRSALMLSGGATWGFHHLGVVKALFQQNLLPDILSGASTGAMIAGGICCRNDAELRELFEHPEQMRLDGLLPVGWKKMMQDKAWLDPQRLYEVLLNNIGDRTFAEAFLHSGRVLNIAVSPTRTRQKPRVLSHLTAPEVMVASAAVASSALPGLFPPVVLQGKNAPYMPNERWVDGSIYEDLPKLRLARLHNVNHFIVSQTNPHVMPFAQHRGQRGITPVAAALLSSSARSQGALAADLARRATRPGTGLLRQVADRSYALISQDYHGDIDIHPAFHLSLLGKIVSNPSLKDLHAFIRAGEQATWAKMAMITDQTRIDRVFKSCITLLRAQIAKDAAGQGTR